MRTPGHCTWTGGRAAALAMLLLPASALAAEPVQGTSTPLSLDEVESIVIPGMTELPDPETIQLDVLRSSLIPIAPDGAVHRGGVMTDAGLGMPVRPATALETLKLDMARAAVEASRAAGTLYVMQLPDDTIPATEDELARMKMQQLEARRSIPSAPDPVAGIGENLTPVQEVGPAGLSAGEEAKLRGETPTAPQGAPAPADASANPISPEGDGAPVDAKKGTSNE